MGLIPFRNPFNFLFRTRSEDVQCHYFYFGFGVLQVANNILCMIDMYFLSKS